MKHSNELSVLACQIVIPETPEPSSRDRHLATISNKIRRELETRHADIVVLPELSSVDYSRQSFDALGSLAENPDGASFQTWQHIARTHQTTVVYSFPRRQSNEFFISVAAIGPEGNLIGYYDKLHLAQYGASMEKEYFSRGEGLFVFDVHGFRVAPIICYDIRIPEMCRTLAVEHGVELVLHCGAYYRDESFYSWHHFAVTRAMENQVYLLSLNRAGKHYGNSIFCAPWIDETQPPTRFHQHDESFVRLTVDRRQIDQSRRDYSFLTDRLDQYNAKV